ncbi:MAG: sigma-70 family RNA polymerase sigma factor [Prevotellaceae bacterium]|nr:sigma-70 family RNA polymerase sigma factor [Candidatus Minthosoma caballi]
MQHYAKMYRVARTILYDEQESKDVVSDIFERLLHGQIVLQPDTVEHYLLTSVRNQCIKRIHHETLKRQLQLHHSSEQLCEESEDERLADVMEFALTHLDERDQRIFNLRFTEGFSYEEIAQMEGISKVAVWKHLSRLINRIKEHFNPTEK